ncbi:hypothetical protein [Nocardiopsis metallicus]|uniref:Uncharacterized protein n=1 Tax=Nocardiopsis metallicus TaxID=179819 RepID=A0A840WFP4_9ACTN|nr:hypothetical protein [Nocardiopsis metallicus]MBB5490775.1 hypothetical protein [Nocardiopsis metallicus]
MANEDRADPLSVPQSRAAADQAFAELVEQQQRTIGQIETITRHARHVLAAQERLADAEAAHRLTHLRSSMSEEGAGSAAAAESDASCLE